MIIYSGFSHQKWWFSILMLVYQRVTLYHRISSDTVGYRRPAGAPRAYEPLPELQKIEIESDRIGSTTRQLDSISNNMLRTWFKNQHTKGDESPKIWNLVQAATAESLPCQRCLSWSTPDHQPRWHGKEGEGAKSWKLLGDPRCICRKCLWKLQCAVWKGVKSITAGLPTSADP